MQEETYLIRKRVLAEPDVAVDAEYLDNIGQGHEEKQDFHGISPSLDAPDLSPAIRE